MSYSATVCGGLPVINVLQRDLRVTELVKFEGILNATSNFVLEQIEKGGSFEDAVKEAQRLGAAEADPSLDIEGYDTANKLFIIMKSFTDFSGSIQDIKIEGIQNIDGMLSSAAMSRNNRVKLVARAVRSKGEWNLEVKPIEVAADSFLGSCSGWEMGVKLQSDNYEEIAMKNKEVEPIGTSAAVLRDIINLNYA